MNASNREFLVQGMSAMLTGAGFNGSFTSYGVTVAVNGTALPAGSSVLFAGDSLVIAFDPWSLWSRSSPTCPSAWPCSAASPAQSATR